MRRVQISYHDHNIDLEPLLPRTGTLGDARCMSGRNDWHVVALDAPFILPYSNPPRLVSDFVIASRWRGHRIEDPDGTSVFLLIPKKEELPDFREWTLELFDHIAWGMAKLVEEPIQSAETTRGK